jgi:hypothetical protein
MIRLALVVAGATDTAAPCLIGCPTAFNGGGSVKKPILFAIVVTLALAMNPTVRAATCVPTGFVRDSINLTAAIINPTGDVTSIVDATGCHIGVYYDGGHDAKLDGADISGSSYYGVLVNTDNGGTSTVRIQRTVVHHVGDVPHSGGQYGVAISLRGFAGQIRGQIDNSQFFDYQKGGIAANGSGVSVNITNNVVIGDGHVTSIAQNGIQVAFGASSNSLSGNYVYGNSYRGDPGDGSSSGGILIAGGAAFSACPPVDAPCDYVVGIQIRDNTLFANDVGVFVFNADDNGTASSIPTNIVVARNVIYGDICYNKVLQAGVSDVGNSDRILRNTIYGPGYLTCASGTTIDIVDAVNPTVRTRMSLLRRPHVFRD